MAKIEMEWVEAGQAFAGKVNGIQQVLTEAGAAEVNGNRLKISEGKKEPLVDRIIKASKISDQQDAIPLKVTPW